MEKKKYISPDMEIIEFEDDVIVTSTPQGDIEKQLEAPVIKPLEKQLSSIRFF